MTMSAEIAAAFEQVGTDMSYRPIMFDSRAEATNASTGDTQNSAFIFVGQLPYKYDANGTALTTGDSRKWSPAGNIYFQHFAENTTPGTTDMTAAVEAAILYASELVADPDESLVNSGNDMSLNDHALPQQVVVSGLSELIAISDQTIFAGVDGVRVENANFNAITPANWSAGMFMFRFEEAAAGGGFQADKSSGVTFWHCSFEGNHFCPGFVLFDDVKNRCGVNYCRGHGMTEVGIRSTTKNGDFSLVGNRFCQFTWDEINDDTTFTLLPDSGATERTAVLFDIQTTDYRVIDNTAFYAKRGFSIGYDLVSDTKENGAWVAGQFMGNHPYGCTEYLAYFNVSTANITGNYLDNGKVRLPAHKNGVITFANNFFLRSAADLASTAYVALELEAVVANATGENLIIVNNGFRYIDGTYDNTSNEVAFTEAAGKTWAVWDSRRYTSFGNKASGYDFDSGAETKTMSDARGIDPIRSGINFSAPATTSAALKNGLRIGAYQASGGQAIANINFAGDRFYIAPTDTEGSYNWSKEFTYDPVGDAVWTAKGGFKTTGPLTATSSMAVSGTVDTYGRTRLCNTTGDGEKATIGRYNSTDPWLQFRTAGTNTRMEWYVGYGKELRYVGTGAVNFAVASEVGFGETSGGTYNGNIRVIKHDQYPVIKGYSGNTTKCQITFDANGGGMFSDFDGYYRWRKFTGLTNLMSLSDTGNLGIGFNAPSYKLDVNGASRFVGAVYSQASTSATAMGVMWASGSFQSSRDGTGNNYHFTFKNNANVSATEVGSITSNGSTTSYNTTSDYRRKENIGYLYYGAERVMQLKPVRFNFKGQTDTIDGFLAHEVQEVVPEAVTGWKDEVDAEGNPVYQQMDASKLIPVLTAALQEALLRIERLETQLETLSSS